MAWHVAVLLLCFSAFAVEAQVPAGGVETIIVIRHGEKPGTHPVGQLSCQGLNRALALPAVLARFGKPMVIFAPNPSVQRTDGDDLPFAPKYSYVRPLATIEPYAIAQGMPVNTQIGAEKISDLQSAILQPVFAHGLVVVAWEHIQARKFAEQLLASFGQKTDALPRWENGNYDTIYVFHVSGDPGGKRQIDFHVEQEQLDGRLANVCPASPVQAKVSAQP